MRILVSVTSDLTNDQRVHKVCSTLTDMGFEVILIGRKLSKSIQLNRAYKTTRIKIIFNKGFLFYTEFNLRIFFKLIFIRKDVLFSNDLDTLIPNYILSKFQSVPLVFDSHELFSELPSVQGRVSQRFWRFIEKWLVPKQQYLFTVSDSIASWFKEQYGVQAIVLKNFPTRKNLAFSESSKKYIIYQGALNSGRGLMALLEAMQTIENVILKIAGDGPLKRLIQERIHQLNLKEKVELLGIIDPEDLLKITQNASLGISLEEDLGLSYRYALPNKLFDYIQAKTPVVATFLPEIRNIVETYKIGEIIDNHSPENIKIAIDKVLDNGKHLYKSQLEKAAKELIWENQEEHLSEVFRNIQTTQIQ